MKRSLIALLLIAALAGPAFGQSIGSTWYDPQTAFILVPTSIPNYVSNGIFADEIDFIFRSPINLADYDGYSVHTAYGNYISLLSGGTSWTNPFTTTGPSISAGDVGYYQLAATFPIFGFRAGTMLGHRYTLTGNISGAGDRTADEGTNTEPIDGNTLGTIDYTETTSYASTAKYTTSTTTGLAGVSLGNLGVSFLVYQGTTARSIGGASSYAWAIGTDAAYNALLPGTDQTTAKTLYVGYGENGAAKNYGGSGTVIAKVLGQYELFGIPLIANFGITSSNNGLGLNKVKTSASQTVAYASTAGVGTALVTDVNTYTASYGTDISGGAGWTMSTLAGAWLLEPGTQYIDPTVSKDNGFDFNFAIGAEPVFVIDDALSFKTKGLLSILSESDTVSTTLLAASTYSEATTAAENDTWAYSYSSSVSQKTGLFTLGFELGGMAEFTDPTGFVTLGAGVFFQPGFGFGSTTNATATTTTTRTYVDSVNANPILAATTTGLAPAAAVVLIGDGVGEYEGSSTLTTTTTYSGNNTKNVLALDINLPTAVKLSFKEGKFAAIFGYTLVHSSKVTTETTADSKAVTAATVSDGTTTVYNSASATDYPAGADLDDTVTTAGNTVVTTSDTWNGQMGWCFRWVPSEALTIDIEGSSIILALNGVGFDDFMLDDILASLGISATFRF